MIRRFTSSAEYASLIWEESLLISAERSGLMAIVFGRSVCCHSILILGGTPGNGGQRWLL